MLTTTTRIVETKEEKALGSNILFFSVSLFRSQAAYYSILIYKALNVSLNVQVKGREAER